MGEEWTSRARPPEIDNPAGYFEDRDFVYVNETIFREYGARTWKLPRKVYYRKRYREWIKKIIVDRVSSAKQGGLRGWGWKDCRTVALLPLYIPHFDGLRLRIVLTNRNSYDSARSWVKVGRADFASCYRSICQYVDMLGEFVAEYENNWPMLHLRYEGWHDDYEGQLAKLSELVGTAIDASIFDRKLRHF